MQDHSPAAGFAGVPPHPHSWLQCAAANKASGNVSVVDTEFAVHACPIIRALTCELVGKNAAVQAARHIA